MNITRMIALSEECAQMWEWMALSENTAKPKQVYLQEKGVAEDIWPLDHCYYCELVDTVRNGCSTCLGTNIIWDHMGLGTVYCLTDTDSPYKRWDSAKAALDSKEWESEKDPETFREELCKTIHENAKLMAEKTRKIADTLREGYEYGKVLEAGCAWEQSSGEDTDGACGHGYEWSCDDCPIVLEKNKEEVADTL